MELTCLCCLAETTVTFKISTRCDFRVDECYDNNQSTSMIQLGELYSQLIQLPPPPEKLCAKIQQICGEICSRCVVMLKDFYRFRTRAIKAYEELQTKANIAKIINSLEQSCVESVEAEQIDEDLENHNLNIPIDQFQNTTGSTCSNCEKKLKDHKRITMHKKMHSNDKKHRCRQCEIEFTTETSCYKHQLRIHGKVWCRNKSQTIATNTKNTKLDKQGKTEVLHVTKNIKAEPAQLIRRARFCCDICLKTFTRTSSLNHHKQVLHAGVRQHVCHICDRTFGKGDSLNTHLALHVGKKYRCKLCNKSFAKSSFLRKHLEEHELPGSKRKYTCVVCSKRFATISHLKDHELIHSNKKPHKCNHCEKSFRQKQQLKAHVNKHHPGREQISISKFGLAKVADASTVSQPDFGDNTVNEEILNEICHQINSNPIILENIDAGGVNLICNEQNIFLNE
ncbi:zinc finger protein 677-like [Anopheles maculipalpis]|uniref:zinc finger protein 677-like n=1 Tax=Anopheles maculipalpis TaxID=1496333 RepID=UPI0021597FEE|nr:zinc finger protein 677-like [Anopheles maculipalpis]